MKILNTRINKNGHVIGFSAIPPENAKAIWPSIEHHAQTALEHSFDGMTAENILQWVITDRLVLVVITVDDKIKASITMEICEGKRGRTCHIMTLGGEEMESWLTEWVPVWVKIAREQGADNITMKGRKGWERVAKEFGFTHQYTQMTKDIREVH